MYRNLISTHIILIFIFGVCSPSILFLIGCGGDTGIDQNQAARVDTVKIKYHDNVKVKYGLDGWQAEIQVVFSQPPVSLQLIEDKVVFQKYSEKVKWEQVGNIVTIYLNFSKAWVKKNHIPTYKLYFTLNWNTGRKQIDTTLKPPAHIAIGGFLPDIPDIPPAAFVSATPASGDLATNGHITVKFDNDPGAVTVNAGSVTGTGKSRTIMGPFSVGVLALTITWQNGEGSHTLNYRVVRVE